MAPSEVTRKEIPSTTTLSTIVLKSKETQVVIALLKCGSEINLKVIQTICLCGVIEIGPNLLFTFQLLDVTPELGFIGNTDTLEEAQKLQTSHNEVLLQMESKQSPVEDMVTIFLFQTLEKYVGIAFFTFTAMYLLSHV